MWHLTRLSDETIKWYKDKFLTTVSTDIHRNNNRLNKNVKKILSVEVVEKLLILEPEILYPFSKEIEEQIGAIVDWNTTRKKLFSLFNYDGNISKNQKCSYELADRIGTKTCVYCNRIYSITAYDNNDENGATLNDVNLRRIVRPDFDHWLSKAEHPLTSMSIYNLIPSCPICNRSIKGTREFGIDQHVHPYLSSEEPTFKFRYAPDFNGKWDLHLEGGTEKEKATARVLETEAVYKGHADMEVKDILDFLYSNTPEYLEDLFTKVLQANGGAITPEEAYKVIFGYESVPSKYLDRPLSKLKHDILEQASVSLGVKLL